MRRAFLALTAVLLLAAIAAFAFWPGRATLEPAAAPDAARTGTACASCTLHHQRLSEPRD